MIWLIGSIIVVLFVLFAIVNESLRKNEQPHKFPSDYEKDPGAGGF
ncbi:hypothetical protein [Bacillus sp. 03113]|nr:hypothetical protein [Bacillus sp. 03113]